MDAQIQMLCEQGLQVFPRLKYLGITVPRRSKQLSTYTYIMPSNKTHLSLYLGKEVLSELRKVKGKRYLSTVIEELLAVSLGVTLPGEAPSESVFDQVQRLETEVATLREELSQVRKMLELKNGKGNGAMKKHDQLSLF